MICNTTMDSKLKESHISRKTHQNQLQLLGKIAAGTDLHGIAESYLGTIKVDGDRKIDQTERREQDAKAGSPKSILSEHH